MASSSSGVTAKEAEEYKEKISNYLKNLKLELHPDKSNIIPLRNGITFLGYRLFYHHKLLRKSNLKKFQKSFNDKLDFLQIVGGAKQISKESLVVYKAGLDMLNTQIHIN